jgi:hypothetical protein
MGHSKIDLSGQRFGRLLVTEHFKMVKKRARWLCICDCGTQKWVSSSHLRTGTVKGCGNHGRNLTHGCSRKGQWTPEYRTWCGIKNRCLDSNQKSFKNYGGRGITVCDRWENSFENFLSDMGRRPPGKYSIERIDNNGNYEPKNCKWDTRSNQQKNKRRRLKSP